MPKFTVITATWNRSHHIIPTIRSVLAQDFTDFEYLIVGDCCTDDTEEIMRPFLSDRVRWLSTSARWKSQSGPNNVGLAQARGDFIAYIGHDDIWGAGHLAAHDAVLSSAGRPDFSVSGYVSHGCPGTGLVGVSGLFDPSDRLESYLFAPSCLAHRRGVIDRIGCWRRPDALGIHVDTDFLLRAAGAGMQFLPTGQINAHKFDAAGRYLSYLDPESWEQEAILAQMLRPGFDAQIRQWLETSKALGTFVPSHVIGHKSRVPGEIAERLRVSRGVTVPEPAQLGRRHILRQAKGWGANDWHGEGPDRHGYRWSGPSPAPRLMLALVAPSMVRIEMDVAHCDRTIFGELKIQVNREFRPATVRDIRRSGNGHIAKLRLEAPLLADRGSVLRLFQPQRAMVGQARVAMTGVAVGAITVTSLAGSISGSGLLRRLVRQFSV